MRPTHAGRVLVRGPLAALVAAAAGAGLAGCAIRATPPPPPPPPTVTVVAVRKADVPAVVHSQGTTRALNDVTVRARVKGFLEKAHFTEGTNVKAGQLLLVIEEEPYQVKLDQARANLAEAEATLKKAMQSKAREIAEAQIHLDEAQRSLDQVEEKRERTLQARGAATIEDVERKQALFKKSTAQVEADQASLEQTRADYETNILAARAKVESAQAEVRDAVINLGYCRMTAPIDGRIGQMLVKPGNLVGSDQNTDLVTIQQLNPMGIDMNPPARRLPEVTQLIKSGLFINLKVEGDREYPEKAQAYFIDNTVELTTGTFLLKARVANKDEELLPGEYVQISATVDNYAGVIVVPEKALIEGQAGPTVYVVDPGNVVRLVAVKTVEQFDTEQRIRVITSGLEPAQKVIVDGIQLVRPGLKVQVEEADLEKVLRDTAEPEPQRGSRSRSGSRSGTGKRSDGPQ